MTTKAEREAAAAQAEAEQAAAEKAVQDNSSKNSAPAAPVVAAPGAVAVEGEVNPNAPAGPGDVPVSERPEYAFLNDEPDKKK